ncbi:hypothetical protein [Pseudomonas siliginis]|uniref:hypothetical protein n=1 Tax=Pseudomonas siliginis TaxID=2842346 RepID=UPI0020935A71|nr:hypothetical protein [Pseudomonas siliginis]UST80143.1 hypothetical protein NF676_02145 [Pseudomonas siliginis]
MATYLVCCDLNQEFDQEEFVKTISSMGDARQVLSGAWVVVSEKNAIQIRDELNEHLDASERLLVVKSGSVGAWRSVMSENKWLADNL